MGTSFLVLLPAVVGANLAQCAIEMRKIIYQSLDTYDTTSDGHEIRITLAITGELSTNV